MRLSLLILILLTACSSIPPEAFVGLTPYECRQYGVDVPDGRAVTGTIVRSEFGWTHDLERECNPSHAMIRFSGCTKAAGIDPPIRFSPTHEYEIWYADTKCVPQHEACHALYEISGHTARFDVRTYQGYVLPACP